MAEPTARISELICKFLGEELLPGENQELLDWRQQHPENQRLFTELVSRAGLREGLRSFYAIRDARENVLEKVYRLQDPDLAKRRPAGAGLRPVIRKWAAAAAILVLAAGSYFWIHTGTKKSGLLTGSPLKSDILPGGNRASLTLGNGTTIQLDSARIGPLASQGPGSVLKVANGLVRYRSGASPGGSGAMEYNTLTTPRGGQYQLVLSDGTRVWLNALSSIRFPIAFNGSERSVAVTGEVYFEVAHKDKVPFRVAVGKELIEDLGTHFNVNDYPDDPVMKITLLEGGIRVGHQYGGPGAAGAIELVPGEQAQVSSLGAITRVSGVNTANEIAWKNGIFSFRESTIPLVMNQLARWYQIEVRYAPDFRDKYHFTGEISRNVPISQVLAMVAQTGVAKFSVKGDTITVLPGISYQPSR